MLSVKYILALFVILSSHLAIANDAEVIKRVQSYLGTISTFEADFLQKEEGQDINATGHFIFARKGKVRLEYTSAIPVLIVVNNGILTYFDKELDQKSSIKVKNTAISFFTGDKLSLYNDGIEIIDAKSQDEGVMISLKYSQNDDEGTFDVFFTTSGNQIQALKRIVIQPNGELQPPVSLDFSDIQVNGIKPQDNMFVIKSDTLERFE